MPLTAWFHPLFAARHRSAELAQAADAAAWLLGSSGEATPLHGDLHHENVLDFGNGDWRAIDPKGLVGEHSFDLVHLLRNPDVVTSQRLLERRSVQIAHETAVPITRLLMWLVAFSGLSAVWLESDGENADSDYALMGRGLALL